MSLANHPAPRDFNLAGQCFTDRQKAERESRQIDVRTAAIAGLAGVKDPEVLRLTWRRPTPHGEPFARYMDHTEDERIPVHVYWYDDRIDIVSPGGPYGAVTPETFGRPGVVDYRNPNLAEALRVLGFVQRFGFGIATARRELERNGNPPPEFEVGPNGVLVRIRVRP